PAQYRNDIQGIPTKQERAAGTRCGQGRDSVPAGKSKQRSGSGSSAQPGGVPYSPERQQAIMQMLRAEGRIDASKVAHHLVFTNALPIALALLSRPRITVYALGGRLRSRTVATVGQWTTRMLADLNVDVAFLGTNGVSPERGLTTPDPAEAEVKHLMVRSARRKILLADHSKVGRVSLCKHADLTDID